MVIEMVDLTDEENVVEQARVKGQEEEKQRQRELEMAKERARKEGQKEGSKQERKNGSGLKVLLGIIVLIIIIGIAALVTLNVTVTNPVTGVSMPFSSNYSVTFPIGQQVTIGNTHITVLTYQNELLSNIDGDQQKLFEGQDRVTQERRAVVTTLGGVTLVDTNFQIDLQYQGQRDNLAYFNLVIHTSKQVPDILLRMLLPSSINASPV
ncbi:MAG TPA: hypothetical protein VMC42_10180 [Methanoregulaceae archaeon]|nr:hypothetical protein [Methanoregulaceae archaeon]